MSLSTEDIQAVSTKLAEMMATKSCSTQTSMAMPSSSMMPISSMMTPDIRPVGLLISMTIPLPDGSEVSTYLQFGQDVLSQPQMIPAFIQQLSQHFPINIRQPRQAGSWSGNGGGGNHWGGNNHWRGNSGYRGRRY